MTFTRCKGLGETDHEFYNSGGKYRTRENGVKLKSCQLWENIKNRTNYLPKVDEVRFGMYTDTYACDEWLDYQKFTAWFEEVKELGYYQEGYQLDKDILVKGNKVYSPETCVFLPEEVNKALNTKTRCRGYGGLPVGLSYNGSKSNYNCITVAYVCKNKQFGIRIYISPEEIEYGFSVYKRAREDYIHYLAELYKNQLDPRAYKALSEYEVSIDD